VEPLEDRVLLSIFNVNRCDDAVDTSPGDGTTLRAAIMEANALPGDHTIYLPARTYELSISGRVEDGCATGDLDIRRNLAIVGQGASSTIIDANQIDRVFHVFAGATVTFDGVTITGGRKTGVDPENDRGAGAILNYGTLSILNSVVSGNSTEGNTGGIYNAGTLAITNSSVSGNSANSVGGISNDGAMTIAKSVVSSNSANDSAGMFNRGSATITDSTVSGNTAWTASGGIHNVGILTISCSTISGNSQGVADGGGINNTAGTLTLTNCTVSGNTAPGRGGGIFSSGPVTLINTTITGNTAGAAGGGISSFIGTFYLRNTLLAGNAAPVGPDGFNEYGGTTVSRGHNLIGNDSDFAFTAAAGDLVGTGTSPIDARLGPLQDNGGPTFTRALLAGSPAIDAGDNADIPATDQRGMTRITDGNGDGTATADIGAYEFVRPPLVVNRTDDRVDATPLGDGRVDVDLATPGDQITLRAAIMEANALPGYDTIILPAGTYTLTIPSTGYHSDRNGDLDVTRNVTIIGAGAATTKIDAGGRYTVLHIQSGATVELCDVAIINGFVPASTYGGAGIWNEGTLSIATCTISDNSAGYLGGGILNNGTLTITRSGISNNLSPSYYASGAGIGNTGTLTVTDSTISGNAANNQGGGICNYATATFTNSTLSGNVRGGIYNGNNGTMTFNSSTISDNSGGGIDNDGTMTVTASTVSGNSGRGMDNEGTMTVTDSTVSGNTGWWGGGIYATGTTTIINSTITANSESGIVSFSTRTYIQNSIVAGNVGSEMVYDAYGSFTSLGNNLIGLAFEATGFVASDQVGTYADAHSLDPRLGPLQDNGGPTFTHALLAGSPAIDAGNNAAAPATDQRGMARIVDGDVDGTATIDIGAYEYVAPPPAVAQMQPAGNSQTADARTDVSAVYDQHIDPASVSDQTFVVHAMQTGKLLGPPNAITVDGQTVTLTLDPDTRFHPGELVQVTASAGIRNIYDDAPADGTVWQFRTAVTAGTGLFVENADDGLPSSQAVDVALGDVNGDGFPDALVAGNVGFLINDGGPATLWLNDGHGNFVQSGQVLGSGANAVALGDLNGDGWLDAYISKWRADEVWLNNGDGTFRDSGQRLSYPWVGFYPGGGFGAVMADIDGDGDLDAFAQGRPENTVWLNDGQGNFRDRKSVV
jgi:hypothetical protein